MDRYTRQTLLPQFAADAQQRLACSCVLLIGCGALGTNIAEQLVRAGVGHLRIVDRDVVELSNLQRQTLFDEADVTAGTPKAIAARFRLRQINSSAEIDAIIADVHSGNIEALAGLSPQSSPMNLLLDGTDNAETRYLINDLAVKHGIPWIYGGCVGTEGRVMPIWPGRSPCLRCLFQQPPDPGELPTCDTAGVLGPAAAMVAAWQATAAIQMLIADAPPLLGQLISFDAWTGEFRARLIEQARCDCPSCQRRDFSFLNRPAEQSAVALCGRNAVQIRPAAPATIELASLAIRLASLGLVQTSPFFLRCQLNSDAAISLSIFIDGRTIVHGTSDLARARGIVSRCLGA